MRATIREILTRTPLFWRCKDFFNPRFPGTAEYWQKRYEAGGDSGTGSYGQLAVFKAEVLNAFVAEHGLETVTELGCGDGAQLSLAAYPKYVGFDISPHAINICSNRFANDKTKSFFLYEPQSIRDQLSYFVADLSISLDVVYHLVEDKIFEEYMKTLFAVSNKYVGIYSSNYDSFEKESHEHHRRFTNFIEIYLPSWSLYRKVDQRYTIDLYGPREGSFADFYFFVKS